MQSTTNELRESLVPPIDVTLYVHATDTAVELKSDHPDVTIGPDFIDFKLGATTLDRLVRFILRPRIDGAVVVATVTELAPEDLEILPNGPFVLPLYASVSLDVTFTPASKPGEKPPKKKKFPVTIRIHPPTGGL